MECQRHRKRLLVDRQLEPCRRNAKRFVSVCEKTTHNNVGNNGETSFHHVMMKMLPNAQGTTLSLKAGELHSLDFEQNMGNTHVEEMDDLEVAVWIQKY